MITRLFLFIFCVCFKMVFAQDAGTVYFDASWKVTTKENHTFYRLMPLKEAGDLVLVKDYYKDGAPQFEGYALKMDDDQYVGDVIWHDVNGNDDSFYQYKNYTKTSKLNYYHNNGKIRKTAQYKDGVKDGETTIYDQKGDLLMKGVYQKGQPISGDFESFSDDYSVNKTDREKEEERDEKRAINVAPPMPYSDSGKKPTKANVKTIRQKIFWINSRNIAQEKVYAINEYSNNQIQQKNYDQTGKLIQSLSEDNFGEYDHRIINGIEYEYYLQNNFATGVKSSMPFVKKEKNGKSLSYFPNGKLLSETNYREGLKEGEELVYAENGSVKQKRIYKENDPYAGNFDESIANYTVNLNYLNGKKEGEAIAKNEKEEIIARGIYKNNEPYKGTFLTEKSYGNDYELINVENYKQSGLQTVFSYSLERISKTYTIQNEKLNGITTYFQDGKSVSALDFKDDEPYNGTINLENDVTVYKNGKLVTETFYTDDSLINIFKQKIYENGIISKIIDSTFDIPSEPEGVYEGIYKDGKPYSGYFETEEDREFKQINYYENGQPKYQYSNNFLDNLDNYRHPNYDIKSTYKDGKIFDGVEYVLSGRQLVSRYFKNGVLKSFDWDLFAVNYFNRIHFELKDKTIEMTDLREEKKAKITLDISKDTFTTKLWTDKYVVDERTSTTDSNFKGKYFENLIMYTIDGGKVTSKNVYVRSHEHDDYAGSKFFYRAYGLISDDFKSVQATFNNLSEIIGTDENEPDENGKYIIAGIRLDKSGKPKDGTMITNKTSDTYKIQVYEERKLVKTIDNVTVENLENELKKLENRY